MRAIAVIRDLGRERAIIVYSAMQDPLFASVRDADDQRDNAPTIDSRGARRPLDNGYFFSAELQTWRRRERATSGAIEVPRRLADLRYHMVPARRTKQVIPLVSEHIGQAIAHASADLDEGDVAAVDARVAQRLDAALMPSRKLPLGQNTSCTASACNGALVSARMHSLLAYTVPACGATAGKVIRHSPRARSLPWALPQR